MGEKSRKKEKARKEREWKEKVALRGVSARIDPIRERYAKDWSTHAAKFNGDGHYTWMAEFVKGRPLVLEVGTGDGAGTLALLANGAVVVSIETNPFCQAQAAANLTQAGVQVAREPRGELTVRSDGKATFKYAPVTSAMPTKGVLLLGGDLLTDPELKSWLRKQSRFDAVVCWNMGASGVENTATGDNALYRLSVQNKVYELADQVLKSGGILHVVDRGREILPGREQEQREDMIQSHREQAEGTTLQVSSDFEVRPYSPPAGGAGVTMIAMDESKYAFDPNKMAFWSMIATKP